MRFKNVHGRLTYIELSKGIPVEKEIQVCSNDRSLSLFKGDKSEIAKIQQI